HYGPEKYMAGTCRLPEIDRVGLAQEAVDDVEEGPLVLAVDARVGCAGQDGEVLVGVGQQLEELDQVVQAGDAVVLAAGDQHRSRDLARVDQRQVHAHVEVGAVRDRVV